MLEVFSFIGTLLLVAVDLVVAFLFSFMVEAILAKDRLWFRLLLMILGIILLQASVYSWLPGRLGMEIRLVEGVFVLRDRALFSNLGALLIAQGIGITIVLAKHLWSVIRRKSRFMGTAFALEFIFLLLYYIAGVSLYSESPSAVEMVSSGTLVSLAATGLIILIAGLHGLRKQSRI